MDSTINFEFFFFQCLWTFFLDHQSLPWAVKIKRYITRYKSIRNKELHFHYCISPQILYCNNTIFQYYRILLNTYLQLLHFYFNRNSIMQIPNAIPIHNFLNQNLRSWAHASMEDETREAFYLGQKSIIGILMNIGK